VARLKRKRYRFAVDADECGYVTLGVRYWPCPPFALRWVLVNSVER
jgi:hypothetical protein